MLQEVRSQGWTSMFVGGHGCLFRVLGTLVHRPRVHALCLQVVTTSWTLDGRGPTLEPKQVSPQACLAGVLLSSGPAPGTRLLPEMSRPHRDCALAYLARAVRGPQPPRRPLHTLHVGLHSRGWGSSREHLRPSAGRLEAPFTAFAFLCSLDAEILAPVICP